MTPSNWEQLQEQMHEEAERYEHVEILQVKDWLQIVIATHIWNGDKRLDIRQFAVPREEPSKGFVPTSKGVVVSDSYVLDFYHKLTRLLKDAGYDLEGGVYGTSDIPSE